MFYSKYAQILYKTYFEVPISFQASASATTGGLPSAASSGCCDDDEHEGHYPLH